MSGEDGITTAVLFATAAADGGGPAAGLPLAGTTLLGRLREQLAALGAADAHVIARPEWAESLASAGARVHACDDVAADLRALAAIARGAGGGVVVASADVLTQGEALAGLLADPRVPSGILAGSGRTGRRFGHRVRSQRGRIVSAGSPYHAVGAPTATFLGVLKVAAADRAALAESAERMAALTGGPLPDGWEATLAAHAGRWRSALRRAEPDEGDDAVSEAAAEAELAALDDAAPDAIALEPAAEAELALRIGAAREDAAALVLVALVRSGVVLGTARVRSLFWARPLRADALAAAAGRMGAHDEDAARLDAAVKASDGFFTTFFVSPYSKYVARWFARRGWTPNAVTLLSAGVGVLAAAGFATGERPGLIAGALLLQVAFMLDCADGQLARYTRTFSRFGAWLDSILDRAKEYAVYAGLAIGASRTGHDVWLLAGAALALQTARHAIDFSYPTAQHEALGAVRHAPLEQPADGLAAPAARGRAAGFWHTLDRSPAGRWGKRIAGFPIGERFAAISVTAALFDARVTFVVLLAWGGFAALYGIAGRVLRSAGRRGATALAAGAAGATEELALVRDDGPLARALGRLPLPAVPAVALVAAGLAPLVAAIAIAGAGASWALAAAVIAWLVLLGGASSGRPLRDPLRWLVPPALRVAEYAGLLWVAAIAGPSSLPAAFALLCAVTFRQYDLVYRWRQQGAAPPRWVNLLAGGWDGRLVAGTALAAAGLVPAGFYAAAALLGIVCAGESLAGWNRLGRTQRPPVYDVEGDAG